MKRFILPCCLMLALVAGLLATSASSSLARGDSFITAPMACPTSCANCSGGEHYAQNYGPFNDRNGDPHSECIPSVCDLTHTVCAGFFSSLKPDQRMEIWRTLATMDIEQIKIAMAKYAFIEYNKERGLLQLIGCSQEVAANLPVTSDIAAALD